MIEKICNITIQGKCFDKEAKLSLFPGSDDRISLIFGRNGSGKSTIADAFQAYVNNDFTELAISLFDNNQIVQNIPETCRRNFIFVFNEKYIDTNVKLADDGLNTIVLLGEQADLDDKIDAAEALLQSALADERAAQSKVEQYSDPQNPLSPDYHLNGIKRRLREDGGWADIEGQIKGSKQKAKVSDDVVNDIENAQSAEPLQNLKKEFDRIKSLQEKVKVLPNEYNHKVELIAGFELIDDRIAILLQKNIKQVEPTEREREIIKVIQQGLQSQVENARMLFAKEDTEYCPYCFQPLTMAYKQELIANIDRVLNKEANEHKVELQNFCFPKIIFEYEKYTALNSELSCKIKGQLNFCNSIMEEYSQLLKNKAENVFAPIQFENKHLEEEVKKLNELLGELEQIRSDFVLAVGEMRKNNNKLSQLNRKIARKVLDREYSEYNRLKNEKASSDADYFEKVAKRKDIEGNISELKQKKENVFIAINEINLALQYIFFSRDRLTIEYKDHLYYLKVNGQFVHPRDVSSGERNIIAFCYFFTQIMSNVNIKDLYKKEMLLVIDDPISSFDFENRIGILSYINAQVKKVIFGNTDSKIVILTHDLSVMFDLQKSFNDICSGTKGNSVGKASCSYLELTKEGLIRFRDKRHEYTEIMQAVYNYALTGGTDGSMYIGNYMRRIVEAFATFNYKQGIDFILKENSLLEYLGDRSDYFQNLMYRLVLNNESHTLERVKGLSDDNSFFNYVSESEKQRTAQDILSLLYSLNPVHIKAHLSQIQGAERNIIKWVRNIPRNDTLELEEVAKKRIPLFEFPLSAGTGNIIGDEYLPSEEIEINAEIDCDCAFKVSGNSMLPEYSDGEIVLVKRMEIVPKNKVGIFFYDGAVYIKQKIAEKNWVLLHSFNPDYSDITLREGVPYKEYGQVVAVHDPI